MGYESGDHGLYDYLHENPIAATDPSGLMPWMVPWWARITPPMSVRKIREGKSGLFDQDILGSPSGVSR